MLYLLFGIALILAFYSVGQFIADPTRLLNRFVTVCFLSLSGILFYFWADYAGFIRRLPFLEHLDISLSFFAAPAIYLTLVTILREGRDAPRRAERHFVFPILFALGFGLYNGIAASGYPRDSAVVRSHFENPGMFTLSLFSDCYLFVYIAATLVQALSLRARGRVTRLREYRIFMYFLGALLTTSAVMLFAYIPRNDYIFVAACSAFGVISIVYSLVTMRLYDYSHGIFSSPRERRKSLRAKWDREAEVLDTRLRSVMDEGEAFTDSSLSLGNLAARLRVSPTRLSYHLNDRYGKNFKAYINTLRIERACTDLLEHPDRSILDIALSSGFNSKSSFNTLFARSLGLSPREYRKRKAGEMVSD